MENKPNQPKDPCKRARDDRPLCRFFVMGTCTFGVNCSFSHVIPPGGFSEGRKQIPCIWHHERKFCRFGSSCHFSHDALGVASGSLKTSETNALNTSQNTSCKKQPSTDITTCSYIGNEEYNCGICLNNIAQSGKRFGLLSNCKHIFCIDCLRTWRGSAVNRKNVVVNHSCPTCRVKSNVVVPSKFFVVGPEKELLFKRCKVKMGKMPCRYFDGSIGSCPFGKDCNYAHFNWNGENLKPNDLRRPPRKKRIRIGFSDSIDTLQISLGPASSFAYLEEKDGSNASSNPKDPS